MINVDLKVILKIKTKDINDYNH